METKKRNYRLFPTFGDSLGTGWDVMMDNFLRLFLLVIIMCIVTSPMQILQVKAEPFDFNWGHWDMHDFFRFGTFGLLAAFYGFLALLYTFLVQPVFRYGSKMIFLQAVRQEKPDYEILIRGFVQNYLSIVLANLLVTALIVLGCFFFIVPGIIVACRLAFVPYIVMDKKLDAIESVEWSWRMTRGHGFTIFLIGFVSIFLYIFGFIMLIVGVIPVNIWVRSSFASLYQSVLLQDEKSKEPIAE